MSTSAGHISDTFAVGMPVGAPIGGAVLGRTATIEDQMFAFFRQALGFASVSGREASFTQFVADWARRQGFHVDLWQADEVALAAERDKFPRHLPLARRPTLVLELPGDPSLRSLMFNAHADVVAAGNAEAWTRDPWSGATVDGIVYGRGACDAKGALVSALWAMVRLAESPSRCGNVMLELVPGEEDCVGLGTLTSLQRGWTADAAVVLEPTEQLPRCASRSGCRFEIEIMGRAVHGTWKWLGRDAIAATCAVHAALVELEADFNRVDRDELFIDYPFARPITVDAIHGGEWQGMVCDRCTCSGYFELLPSDDVGCWQQRLTSELRTRLQTRGLSGEHVRVRFSEQYSGHRLDPAHEFCRYAADAVVECGGRNPPAWAGFNSGCEAGLRANRANTPTLVWGPGSLAHAHAVDEHVAWTEVRQVAEMLTTFADHWTRTKKHA